MGAYRFLDFCLVFGTLVPLEGCWLAVACKLSTRQERSETSSVRSEAAAGIYAGWRFEPGSVARFASTSIKRIKVVIYS